MAWPTSPEARSAKISSLYPTLVSTAQSLKRQVRTRGGQRWKIEFVYGPMSRADFAPLWAAILAMRGQWNTTTVVVPGYSTPLGTWAGSAVADGASQVGRAIALRGLTAGATGKAGDFLKFADSKVYMLVADFTADGTGKATANLEPALIVSPADGEAVVSASVPFTVALGADLAEAQIEPAMLHSFNVSLVEAY